MHCVRPIVDVQPVAHIYLWLFGFINLLVFCILIVASPKSPYATVKCNWNIEHFVIQCLTALKI